MIMRTGPSPWTRAPRSSKSASTEFPRASYNSYGWNIMLISQSANTPEMNVVDLELFSALQILQYRFCILCIEDLIEAVEKAYEELRQTRAWS
ncbi:hypothetical protein ON010_g15582 [Phytophthora cinnamomi]|nr:hypothetical protein ON010_g15582 [Phytophthora cinnamomi]